MRDLADGSRSLRATLRWPPRPLSTCTVFAVIVKSKNMGPTGAKKVLADAGVDPLAQFGYMKSSCRIKIINHLPKRAT